MAVGSAAAAAKLALGSCSGLLSAAAGAIQLLLLIVERMTICVLAGMSSDFAGTFWSTDPLLRHRSQPTDRCTPNGPKAINPEGATSLNYFIRLVLAFLDPAVTFNSSYGASRTVEFIGVALAALGGLWLLRRKLPFFPSFAVLSLAIWLALNAAGIAPSAYNRHFMGLLPVMSILCAAGACRSCL